MANLPALEAFPESAVCIFFKNNKQLRGEGIFMGPEQVNCGSERGGMLPSTGKTEFDCLIPEEPCDRENLIRQRADVIQASSSG